MSREKVRLGLRLIFSLAMSLFIFGGLAHAQQRYSLNQYFPLTEGATWTYQRIKSSEPYDIEVNSIAKISDPIWGSVYRKFLFDSGEQSLLYSYEDMNWTKGGLEVYRSVEKNIFGTEEITPYDPPLLRFPASMSIGDTFTSGDYSITLVGVENVTIAIGTFSNCLKFSITTAEETYDIWLARGIGIVNTTDFAEAGGLVSFTKGSTTYYPIP